MGHSAQTTHRDRVRSVLADDAGPARSAVAASWRRSLTLHGLDPEDGRPPETLTEQQLRLAREAMEPLMRAASGALDRLFTAVGDTGCCVLLTNRDGIPVDRRGAATDDETFHRWGLWTGAVWSEAVEGANAIGTCLVESRPLTIHRDQHFHTRNIGLSCTAHPIFDHMGRLAGALDVSSCRADATEAFTGLISAAVADAVRAIEAQNFRLAFPDARIVLASSLEGDRNASALLAVDRDDLVIGATRAARLALGVNDERIKAQLPASALLSGGAAPDLMDAERSTVRRALAMAGGNVSAAARALGVSRATLHRKLNRLGLH